MDDTDLLDSDARRAIFEQVRDRPGIHLRAIHRATGLSFGQLLHHLHRLTANGDLAVRKDGRFSRYFIAGSFPMTSKRVLGILRHEVPRKVVVMLICRPDLPHAALLEHLGVSPSTLSFHLGRMVEAGVLTRTPHGREVAYRVVDEALCARLLVLHRESFECPVTDRFVDLWLSMNFRERSRRHPRGAEGGPAEGLVARILGLDSPEAVRGPVLDPPRPFEGEAHDDQPREAGAAG